MSNVISHIKNTSGTVNAEVANSDVANSFDGYANFSQKMKAVSAGSYRRLNAIDAPKVIHTGMLPKDAGGSLELVTLKDHYCTIEYDISNYKNKYLVFNGEHQYDHSAFVITDATGKVLAKDSCTDNSKVTPVVEEVLIDSTATKAYCGIDMLGYKLESAENILRDVHKIYVNDYNDAVNANCGMFYNYMQPDGFIYNHYVSKAHTIGVSVLRSLNVSNSHCLAYKRVKRGQTYRAYKLAAEMDVCGAATVDENMSLLQVFEVPQKNESVIRDTCIIDIEHDGWLLWNYTGPDVMGALSLDIGVPPFSTQHMQYTDFPVRIDSRNDIEWDTERQGYYGFYQGADAFEPYDGIRVSKPLKVSGTTLWLKGTWCAQCPLAVLFDANGNKIMQIPQSALNDTSGYIDTPIYVPVEAKTMVLHDISSADAGLGNIEPPELYWYYGVKPVKDDHDTTIKGNVLAGKKYVACGDSFTAANNLGNDHYDADLKCYESYAYMIAKRNDMVYAPDAISGSTITVTESEWERYPFSKDRYKNIPEDADYVTLMFGLNELNAPLGTKGSTDNTTVWGAWDVVLEWILTNRPKARVGIIIADAWMSQSYAQALIDIANYWGVPYLDLGGDPKIPLMNGGRRSGSGVECSEKAAELRNRQHYQSYPKDSHPNYDGHMWRSTVIEDFLRSL